MFVTAASSAATPVIPPGVNLIVFTLIAQISLGRTFAAGYIPGILMAISMMIVVSIIAHKRNYPTTREKFPSLKEIVKQGITSFWGLFFPFGIILGMRFGMFTPSEGGAVAVLYCIIIGRFVYKKLSLKEHLVPILLDSIAGTSSVVLIMVAANVFGYYMTWINLPRVVATGMLSLTTNKWLFLMACNVILLIMGRICKLRQRLFHLDLLRHMYKCTRRLKTGIPKSIQFISLCLSYFYTFIGYL